MINRSVWVVRLALLYATMVVLGGLASANAISLAARVDLKRQQMEVYVDGVVRYRWPISSGRAGWETAPGSYMPYALRPYHYSKRWNMHLTHVVWIGEDGTAIHGTTQVDKLGSRASHGCIRLAGDHAATFYRLVEAYGIWNTEVVVVR